MNYDRFEVLTFDCFGTLIDWETGILNALRPLLASHEVATTDDQLLETYALIEAALESQAYMPYRKILQHLVVRLGEALGFTPEVTQITTLVDSFGDWPAFPDTVDALHTLKTRYKLAIVSNVDDDLFALTNKTLATDFDHVVTAAQAEAYKPSPAMFELATNTIGVPRDRILHVAQSLFHDHVPAKKRGFTTCWINRRHLTGGAGATPPATARPDVEFPDM
ncbi:MAG: haloacid dehalogenase type II, partial [candidate division Zixibacteria bacterium]|nr:haloacid dehalogenase type II [candidate division Zixibacteria bacterium]